MKLLSSIKRLFKGRTDNNDSERYFSNILNSFTQPSFVDGYDDHISMYLQLKHKRMFSKDEVMQIVKSNEFRSAFMDLDRYDLDLTEVEGALPADEWKRGRQYKDGVDQADWFDQIYSDNFVYVRFLVDSLVKNKGLSYYQITVSEQLLGAEYGTMRQIGFVLHFITNFATEFEEAMGVIDYYTQQLESKKAIEFMSYFRGKLGC